MVVYGGTIDVGTTASGTVLQLDDNTIISNGKLTIGSNSTLDIEKGAASLLAGTPDAMLDGVTVGNGGTIDVGTTASGTVLQLDDNTVISNGKLTIGSNSTLDIEKGAALLGPGTPDATLDSVTVGNGGTIDVGTTASGTVLQLDDNTVISNGKLTIGSNSTLDMENGADSLLAGMPNSSLT